MNRKFPYSRLNRKISSISTWIQTSSAFSIQSKPPSFLLESVILSEIAIFRHTFSAYGCTLNRIHLTTAGLFMQFVSYFFSFEFLCMQILNVDKLHIYFVPFNREYWKINQFFQQLCRQNEWKKPESVDIFLFTYS